MELDFIAFVIAFCIVVFFTPSLIRVSILKHLMDKPDMERKFHHQDIPTIGGIMIFAGTLFSYAICFPSPYIEKFNFVLASVFITFFVGIKDDIIGTAPLKKLAANLLVAFIMVFIGEIKIRGLHGIFGLTVFFDGFSEAFSVFTIIVIMNAFNLVDGVDGLAAGVGFIATMVFGTWFLLAGNSVESCLSFALAGALLGFLGYNYSPAKIFMGDSGSLTIGIIIAFLSVQLIEYEKSYYLVTPLDTISKPALAVSCLFYPLTDTLRIFILRVANGKSPLSADRNHIHHRLMDAGYGHRGTVNIIYGLTLCSITTCFITRGLEPEISMACTVFVPYLFMQVPALIKNGKCIW